MTFHADVLIVGGGPVGASLALALGSSIRVSLVEARATSSDDTRTLALSQGTARILQQMGITVESLGATPIETIHVSQRGGFGRTLMRAAELKLPALGYVASYAALSAALDEALAASGASVTHGARVGNIRTTPAFAVTEVERDGRREEISARLIVLADGGRSIEQVAGIAVSEHDYHQSALIAQLTTEPPASTTAYERFTSAGPAALLPYRGRYALVWTTTPQDAQELLALDSRAFLDRLQQHFGAQRLRFMDVGQRATFPLRLRYVKPVTGRRVALIGNAAQALHPVAGQGFNLGMRDVQALAKCLVECDRDSLGSPAMLSRYRAMRRWDASGGIAVTDLLARGFSNDNPVLRAGRGVGLAALDLLPPARKWLARKMMFGISG